MDSRSTQFALAQDATLALEWEHINNSTYDSEPLDDAELAIRLFAEETRATGYEENDYILARRMQDEENAAAMAGPSNHRRTRSADVVTTHSNGYAYLMILVSFEADGNFSYIGGNNSGSMYTGKCRQL